ncbi:unnamed protein product [Paramecium octaurelia]|uniref:Uncharacterized protein n=1 Tax=Paramecium octaurelia TaxID=43137 RepID=A0A8S1TRT2_PAROT|nr:unnamed protein product [Paramecium octaurelia]
MIQCQEINLNKFSLNSTVSAIAFKKGYLSNIACFLILLIFGFMASILLTPIAMLLTLSHKQFDQMSLDVLHPSSHRG